MDTLLLFRDSTCSNVGILGETVPTKVIKVIDSCQSCANVPPTNCNDLGIAISVCVALVVMALIAKCGILSWKSKIIKAEKEKREFQKEKEKAESERKLVAELLEKKLQILKALCYETKDGDSKLKAYGDDIKRYFDMIDGERGEASDTSIQTDADEASSGQ